MNLLKDYTQLLNKLKYKCRVTLYAFSLIYNLYKMIFLSTAQLHKSLPKNIGQRRISRGGAHHDGSEDIFTS